MLNGRCVLLCLLVGTVAPLPGLSAQAPCAPGVDVRTELGWEAYRDGRIDDARRSFEDALTLCPESTYARTGLGYVQLRHGRTLDARSTFERVLSAQPRDIDALVGLGLAGWRQGDLDTVRSAFEEVLSQQADHPTAIRYLDRLHEAADPPARTAQILPDTLEYPARTKGERFEVRGPDGWEPFYVMGVNLGAALPGRHPSQFPDASVYETWLERIARTGANSVRLYTIHPPHFYQALQRWNRQNPDRVLWLIQGVWTSLPEDHDFAGPTYQAQFFEEMLRVVDVVHGRADVSPRPGHTSGHYDADVSRWTLAYIIGREWEPFAAVTFDAHRPGESGYQGRYLTVQGGTALDAWLGQACEALVAYETETYRAQRPVAYTNWPTLDPLHHPTETSVDEEMAIRRARGESPDLRPREYDNDRLDLDASRVRPTTLFPAGYFAAYHAYPYYPDFMIHQEAYAASASSMGPSNYIGYLRELQSHHEGMPVLVAEYGVPASIGIAHVQPQGWHHGGHTEARMAEIDRRLTLDIAEAGLAGGILFSWIDEWFKKNWVTIDFELPADRNRFWLNRLDAEQHYGMWAIEARPPFPGDSLDERLPHWRRTDPLLRDNGGNRLWAAHDAAYLWLLLEAPIRSRADTLLIGFDMIDPERGDLRWPGKVGPELPVGIEFVLRHTEDEVRLLVDSPQNPFRHVRVGQGGRELEGRSFGVEDPPPGLFQDRVEQRFALPYYTELNSDGRYDSLRVVVNRRRFTRDSTEFLATGYDRGVLRHGTAPDGLWERSDDGRFLEIRIPWGLLNVTDPSSRRILQGPGNNVANASRGADGRWRLNSGVEAWPDSLTAELGTETIDAIGIVVSATHERGRWVGWGAVSPGGAPGVARYRWAPWDVPEWVERPRPVVDVMQRTWAELANRSAARAVQDRAPDAERDARTRQSSTETAEIAWQTGDQERALRLYQARLDTDPQDEVALHRVALLRAWNGEYAEAIELFDRMLRNRPDHLGARVDRARVLAWQGLVEQAITELDQVLLEAPEHTGALEALAMFEAWRGRYDVSLATYDRLLAIVPRDAAARRDQARVLAWASRFEDSRRVYDTLLAHDPDDVEARLGLARLLSFSDQLEEATTEYRRILSVHRDNVAALRGLGRTLGWQGRLIDSEATLRRAVAVRSNDVESLIGLAQVLRWQGRNAAAAEVMTEATARAPASQDVREQLEWLHAALGPRARVELVLEGDSDGNRSLVTTLTAGWHPVSRLGVEASVEQRTLDQASMTSSAYSVRVSGRMQLEPGWTLSGTFGGSDGTAGRASSAGIVRAEIESPGRYPYHATLRFESSPLLATAALADRGVRVSELSATGTWHPVPAWRVDLASGAALFDGSERNRRTSVSGSLSHRVGRAWTLGAGVRAFSFEKDLDDQYFDPDFYGVAEFSGRWSVRSGSWALTLELAPGMQQVGRDRGRSGALRASGRMGYRLAPGREVSVAGGYSSTALRRLAGGVEEYSHQTLVFGFDWLF